LSEKKDKAEHWKAQLWKADNPLRLLTLLNYKYQDNFFEQQLALKVLDFAEASTIIMYIPQIF